jgi:hypothetical protein
MAFFSLKFLEYEYEYVLFENYTNGSGFKLNLK